MPILRIPQVSRLRSLIATTTAVSFAAALLAPFADAKPPARKKVLRPAHVRVETAILRAGPDEEHRRLGLLDEGRLSRVIGRSGTWRKVRLESGTEGWVRSDLLQVSKKARHKRNTDIRKAAQAAKAAKAAKAKQARLAKAKAAKAKLAQAKAAKAKLAKAKAAKLAAAKSEAFRKKVAAAKAAKAKLAAKQAAARKARLIAAKQAQAKKLAAKKALIAKNKAAAQKALAAAKTKAAPVKKVQIAKKTAPVKAAQKQPMIAKAKPAATRKPVAAPTRDNDSDIVVRVLVPAKAAKIARVAPEKPRVVEAAPAPPPVTRRIVISRPAAAAAAAVAPRAAKSVAAARVPAPADEVPAARPLVPKVPVRTAPLPRMRFARTPGIRRAARVAAEAARAMTLSEKVALAAQEAAASADENGNIPMLPPNTAPVPSRLLARGDRIVRTALGYRGTPYRFGARGRGAFDCSGFTSYLFQKAGAPLPRTAAQQYRRGKSVSKSQLQPGDLVFFKNTYKRGVSHVGIYIGEGRFVHASSGRGVRVDSLSGNFYRNHWAGARRHD